MGVLKARVETNLRANNPRKYREKKRDGSNRHRCCKVSGAALALRPDKICSAEAHERLQEPPEKIQSLNSEQLAEVEDFSEFVRFRSQERAISRAASNASAPALAAVWNNPEDDVYDALLIRGCRSGLIPVHESILLQAAACRHRQYPHIQRCETRCDPDADHQPVV